MIGDEKAGAVHEGGLQKERADGAGEKGIIPRPIDAAAQKE